MHEEFTVREFAVRERVTVRTVRTWIAKGAVEVRRTPGGGVRIIERRLEPRGCNSMIFGEERRSLSS